MLNDGVFQMIFDEISLYLPDRWDRTVIYLEYGESSYSFSFYVKSTGHYTKCFDLPEIDEDQLLRSFKKIDKVVSLERRKESGNQWSNMTMIVDNKGNMHTDFDFTDMTESAYQYSKAWKKKYLV